jgi:anhydro-N-acetylmuramic acid kinase
MSVDAGTSPGDDRVSAFPVTVPLFKPGFRRMKDPRYAVGFMTGTSVDGIDAAVIEARGFGTTLSARIVDHVHAPLDDLRPALTAFARGEAMTAAQITRLSRRFGELHAELLNRCRDERSLALVAAHGQTVTHAPPDSLQLLDPWPIVREAACPVVHDLRGADLAGGGAGAPITPRADAVLFRNHRMTAGTLAIVNLGGFVNVTLLPEPPDDDDGIFEGVEGFDCCPCNHLLDAAAEALLGTPFDVDGEVAMAGTPDAEAASRLRDSISGLFQAGRSGGDGDEMREHAIEIARSAASPADGLATLHRAVASAVIDCVQTRCDERGIQRPVEFVLAGGGVLNRRLVEEIGSRATVRVRSSDALGVPAQAREAAAMAILGLLAFDGLPITDPASTGRRTPAIPAGRWCGLDLPNEF